MFGGFSAQVVAGPMPNVRWGMTLEELEQATSGASVQIRNDANPATGRSEVKAEMGTTFVGAQVNAIFHFSPLQRRLSSIEFIPLDVGVCDDLRAEMEATFGKPVDEVLNDAFHKWEFFAPADNSTLSLFDQGTFKGYPRTCRVRVQPFTSTLP